MGEANSSPCPVRRTHRVVIDQSALAGFGVDVLDGLLVDHVESRLVRRSGQKIMLHPTLKTPLAWVDYGTLKRENYFLSRMSLDRIGRRFRRLVDRGVLVSFELREQDRGCRMFFGLSERFKAELESVETELVLRQKQKGDHPAKTPDRREGSPGDHPAKTPDRSYDPVPTPSGLRPGANNGSESRFDNGEDGLSPLMPKVLEVARRFRGQGAVAASEPPKGKAT
jgi:hypothetical protein